MRLAKFILANIKPILKEWEEFAASLAPGETMTKLALRDDAELILRATAQNMQVDQSSAEQEGKSKGDGDTDCADSDRLDKASALHGVDRVGAGFDIMEVIAEYRALRANVLRLWRKSFSQSDLEDIDDITRFNEAMDQSLYTAVGSYTERVERSRRLFLAILGHDLRNPLNCIRMAALLISGSKADLKSAEALAMINSNMEAVERLIRDLIDFASTGLGSSIPLARERFDLEEVCREVFEGFRVTHPHRTLRFHSEGDLIGNWDPIRLRQVVCNLMGNAMEHGSLEEPVELSITSEESTVVLSLRNEGEPIPADMLTTIFDPLVRYATVESTLERMPGNIGLGLYIVREIVVGHGGRIEVASSAREGTIFTVHLPRQPAVEGEEGSNPKAERQ